MNKLQLTTTLFLLAFLLFPASSNAQEVLCDNEDNGVCVSWDFVDAMTFEIVDNPDTTGINTSAKVLRFETNPGTDYPIFVHDFSGAGALDFGAWPVYSVKVWTSLTDAKLLWKFEDVNQPAQQFTEREADIAGGAWEEVIFDFTGDAATDIIKFVIFPDFGPRNRQADWYFDDFTRWDALPATSNETDVPLTFALDQNYPNPFNPSTQISFVMQEAGEVSLSIFDSNGSEIKQLMSGYESAGQHQIRFNAEGLSSGVYFYKLAVDGVTVQRKMILNQ